MAAALRFLGVTSIDHEPSTNWDDLLAEAPRGDGVSWTQFLSNTHLSHVLPDILPKEQHIHHLHETDSVQAALALFLDKHINGAPVLDGKLVKGSVTLLDCIVFELGTGGAKSSLPVKDIMNLSGRSESPRIDARASVLVALALLTRPEVSALCIVDEHEHIKAYLTASTLMVWLAKQARARLPARALHTKVADFKTQVIKPVVSVSSSKTLDHALEAIWRKAINAVAVVDEHDRLVGTISASDLKHFDVSDVPALTSHLKGVYINAVLQQQQAVSSSARLLVSGFTGPASQLTCTVNDSIELLLDKIEHRHVHRIWVVDEATSKPIGVISIGDLMAEIARQ